MKKKIMIADDDSALLEMLEMVLSGAGYETSTTLKGDYLINFPPKDFDLILLDVRMSGVNGFEICKFLKSQQSTRHIPIIMVSAIPKLEESTKNSAADDYLEKPFNMSGLLNIVDKYVHVVGSGR